ncbi:serine protease [Mesorhizobium escarrei]|uniref:Serine protease n=1 Tax=Mesorhizobium escarrei TaxID=666018 RepID=A0ABN8JXP1_9HYPH|nr:serine protease [Mesorhizobium escarrei]CAH2402739.1 Serine protease (modular protein) [Mesorhizobium escarrei]
MTTFDSVAVSICDAAKRYAKDQARAEVAALTAALAAPDASLSEKATEKLILCLNESRWFDLSEEIGEALLGRGGATRLTRQRYAQAMIERGKIGAARAQLQQLAGIPKLAPSELAEVRGLIGRAVKQNAVTRRRMKGAWPKNAISEAIRCYSRVYAADPPARTWHGINAVALLALAGRHGISPPAGPNPQSLAQQIIDHLEQKRENDRWDHATWAEACVALGQWDEAARHLSEYIWHPAVNAFALGSTLRQFEEIWELDEPGHPGGKLLTLLRARLVEVESGSIVLQPAQVRGALESPTAKIEYEKVFGKDHFVTLENYLKGVERCRAVARIGREFARGDGTGFLMRGSDFSSKLGPETVLVTNAHVIDPTGESEGIPPGEVVISLQAHETVPPTQELKIAKVLWSSPRKELDVTVAELDVPVPLTQSYPLAQQLPKRGARVIVIGHPGGGTLSFSLADNELLDYEDAGRLLHYRTPTEGGNSGSPVFSHEWRLIGLHHAGGDGMPRLNGQAGTYQANEGIRIDHIRSAFDASYSEAC